MIENKQQGQKTQNKTEPEISDGILRKAISFGARIFGGFQLRVILTGWSCKSWEFMVHEDEVMNNEISFGILSVEIVHCIVEKNESW